jgi:hypothetical protein
MSGPGRLRQLALGRWHPDSLSSLLTQNSTTLATSTSTTSTALNRHSDTYLATLRQRRAVPFAHQPLELTFPSDYQQAIPGILWATGRNGTEDERERARVYV